MAGKSAPEALPPAEKPLAAGDVAASRLLMSQWMTAHSCADGQHKLALWGLLITNINGYP